MKFKVDDLWTPDQPLPCQPLLRLLIGRAGLAWGCPDLPERISIGYNTRMRSTLGRAVLEKSRVELNPRLLRAHPNQFIPTLVHELAHLVVYQRYGRVPPHGPPWRALMAAVKIRPAATHKLPTAHLRRARRRYLYLHRCSQCGMTFLARSVRRNCFCRACGPGMTWAIHRAPDGPEGLRALRNLAGGGED